MGYTKVATLDPLEEGLVSENNVKSTNFCRWSVIAILYLLGGLFTIYMITGTVWSLTSMLFEPRCLTFQDTDSYCITFYVFIPAPFFLMVAVIIGLMTYGLYKGYHH